MNALHLWKCDCGIRFKVMTIIDRGVRNPVLQSGIQCPGCSKIVDVDGKLMDAHFQGAGDDSWVALDSPSQFRQQGQF